MEIEARAAAAAPQRFRTFRKLLTLEFGKLPEAAVQSIASGSEVELDDWLERVLTADSLDAVAQD